MWEEPLTMGRAGILLVIVLGLFGLALVGCSRPQDDDAVVLWTAFEAEIVELRRLTAEFERRTGRKVTVLKVPFVQLQNKFLVAAPADQGPDLLIGPQDWLGVFATAGLLDTVPENLLGDAVRQDLVPVALEGVTFNGQVYAMPLMVESLALIRNPNLLDRTPRDTNDLLELALQVQQSGENKGFYYDIQDFYLSFPFFSAYGAYLFGERDGKPDINNLGLDNAGAVAAAEYLTRLRQSGLIPLGTRTDFAKSLYLEGRVAMTLNGPWFLGDMRGAGVPYVIEPIPPAPDGHPALPLVGITSVMLNHKARHREGALELMAYLSDPETVVSLASSSGRPPARRSALAVATKDPVAGAEIAAFARVCEHGVPMPNHPAAAAIWEPMKQALDLITKGQRRAGPELQRTQQRIQEKIRLMME